MRHVLPCLVGLTACFPGPVSTPPPAPPVEIAGTQVLMNVETDWSQPAHFYDFPFPSDLRLLPTGEPDLNGFPNDGNNLVVESLRNASMERKGFPSIPVAYFTFEADLQQRDADAVIPAASTSPVLLIDVDPDSPERGRLFPTVATTPKPDDYVPASLLAVSSRPGFVLAPSRTYAFVIMQSLLDANGAALGSPLVLEQLKAGVVPDGAKGEALKTLYAPPVSYTHLTLPTNREV